MKVASLASGRDGKLVLVSDDLSGYRLATDPNLQMALDHDRLSGNGMEQPFDPLLCAAPLPRSYQFLAGSAYAPQTAADDDARGAQGWDGPLMYQGLSMFDGPWEPMRGDAAWGVDFEAQLAVITADVPLGVLEAKAATYIRYVMLINGVSLRHLMAGEMAKGAGFVQSKPRCACAPVAVTPDGLPGWDGRKMSGVLCVNLNGMPFGRADAGVGMAFDFGALIAHAAKTRALPAGTVLGAGGVSNLQGDDPPKPVIKGGTGYCSIDAQRRAETLLDGAPKTPFLRAGDHVEMWMEDPKGASIFGKISQKVEGLTG